MKRRAFLVSAGAASLVFVAPGDGLAALFEGHSAVAALGGRYLASLDPGPRRLEARAAMKAAWRCYAVRRSFPASLRRRAPAPEDLAGLAESAPLKTP